MHRILEFEDEEPTESVTRERLSYWQVTVLFQSGRKEKVSGIAGNGESAQKLAKHWFVRKWAQDYGTLTIVGLKEVGRVEFGV